MSTSIDVWRAQFERFAHVECRGRSPLYAEICLAVAEDDALLELYGSTPERQRRPNLLLAAMHYLLLAGTEHVLAAHFPTVAGGGPPSGTAAAQALAFCDEHADEIARLLATRSTQTNEVNRCAALLPALAAATPPGRTLRLVELGASAGLNLLLDRYAYRYSGTSPVSVGDSSVVCECDVEGTLPPLDELPAVGDRIGVDLNPIDVRDEDAARWLLACLFADQPHRADRLRAALAVARRAPPRLVQADGPTVVAELALTGDADMHPTTGRIEMHPTTGRIEMHPTTGRIEMHPVVWHSAALVYTYESQQRALTKSLDRAGARTDLTWIFLEGREGRAGLPPVQIHDCSDVAGFALVAVSYRGGERSVRQLAHVDAHGAAMRWLG